MAGGEAHQLTAIPQGASAPVWSPDGPAIAYLGYADAEDAPRHG